MSGSRLCRLAGCAALLAQPAVAADEPPSPTEAALKQQTAEIIARSDLVEAQTKLAKARLDALGLAPAKGETTLADGAGAMEAWMLSAAVTNAAARTINEKVGEALAGDTKPRVLLAGDDHFDLAYGELFRRQMSAVRAKLEAVTATAGCPASATTVATIASASAPAVAGAILGLFRTDVEVRPLGVELEDRALVNAIAATGKDMWVVPGEAVALKAQDSLLAGLDAVAVARRALVDCRLVKAADKAAVAAIDASVAAADGWYDNAVKPDTNGQSPLVHAAAALSFADRPALRVSVEKAGGSLLKRTNVWTALGAPAVALTGGLVVSYRLVTPVDGKVVAAGLLVCRTKLTSMNAVQAGKVRLDTAPCADGVTSPAGTPASHR